MYPYDNVTLTTGKTNLHPLQAGDDPTKWVTAPADWNPAMQALADLQGALLNARYFGFGDGSAQANSASGKARLRYNPANGTHGALEYSVDAQNYVAIGGAGADGRTILSGSGVPGGGLGNNGDLYIDTTNNLFYGPKAAGAWGSGVSLVGPSGRTILFGTTTPSNGTGVNGDFYVDTVLTKWFGPKAAGAWPAGVSLIGAKGDKGDTGAASTVPGPAGTDGTKLISGVIAPTNGVGANGDSYIDTVAKMFYSPKAAGVWPAGFSIVGPAGAAGSNGSNGSAGTNGTNGTNGFTILNGATAPGGGTGVNGDFYYDTVAIRFYGPKAAGAWGAGVSLVGPQGNPGTNGTNGLSVLGGNGPPSNGLGVNGDQYVDLTNGRHYVPKAGGVWGASFSLLGAAGAAGTNGTNGVNGFSILNGTSAPGGGTGANGDFYIDKVAWFIYGPKAAGAWPAGVSIVGPQGPAGPTAEAPWSLSLVRYFRIDYANGDDGIADPWIDAVAGSTISTSGHACKTIERFHQVFQKQGGGRIAVVLIAPRAGGASYLKQDGVTVDLFDFTGCIGYSKILVRGSTDLSNSVADRLLCGFMQVPGTSASYTCSGGSASDSTTVSAGTLPSDANGAHYRARFSGNVTSGLANFNATIHSIASGVVTWTAPLGASKSNGDTFAIEQPGVVVRSALTGSQTGSATDFIFAGIRTTSAGQISLGLGSGNQVAAGCVSEVTTGTTLNGNGNVGALSVVRSYVDEGGVNRTIGGCRFAGAVTVNRHYGSLIIDHAGFMGPQSNFALRVDRTPSHSLGNNGACTWASTLEGLRSSSISSQGASSFPSIIIGRGTNTSIPRSRIIGDFAAVGGLNMTANSCWVDGLDITGCVGPAIYLFACFGDIYTIEDVTGSTNNLDVGVSVDGSVQTKVIVSSNVSVAGAVGQLRAAGNALSTYAGLSTTTLLDRDANELRAPSNNTTANRSNVAAILVTNHSGGALSIGDAVRYDSSGNLNVTAAVVNGALPVQGVDGFMITPPANGAPGYMLPAAGAVPADFTSIPTTGAVAYLSTTPGKLTTTPSPVTVGRVSSQIPGTGGHFYWRVIANVAIDYDLVPYVYRGADENGVATLVGMQVQLYDFDGTGAIGLARGNSLARARGWAGVAMSTPTADQIIMVARAGIRDILCSGALTPGVPVWLDRSAATTGGATTLPATDDNQGGSGHSYPIGYMVGASARGAGWAQVMIVPCVFDSVNRFPSV